MDSVSQVALGAALGELVLGRSIGRRAAVLGAVLGTLPDLDVLVPYADAIDSFTRHRSWSHSVLVLTAASLPLAVLARRFAGRASGTSPGAPAPATFARWWFGVWLVLVTHPLLDGFTLYGTQVWWPLPLRPVAIGSVFIIDPLYTLPLVVGVAWLWRRRSAAAYRANAVGLVSSTLYLGLTLLVQAHVAGIARASLAADGRDASRLLVAPFPLSLLWRVVALDEDGHDGARYLEGWRSVLDRESTMAFVTYERDERPLDEANAWPAVRRFAWFTDGFYRTREHGDELVVTDLRMGAESNYVFSFVIGERDIPGDWRAVIARDLPPEIDVVTLGRLVRRVVDSAAFEL